jgi:hypothetical protein
MKKILLLLMVSQFTIFTASAQNLKISSVQFKYKDIPGTIRDIDENTFSVDVRSNADLNYIGTSTGALANRVSFNTLSKVDGYGDIKFDLRIGSYNNLTPKLNEVKSKEGVITGYYYTCTYAIPFTYTIVSKSINWNNHGTKTSTNGDEETYTGKTFAKSSEAYTDWNNGGMQNIKSAVRTSTENKITNLCNLVSENIEFIDRAATNQMYYFKTTKKEDFTAYETACESSVELIKTFTPTTVRTDMKSKFESHLNFWKNNLPKLDPKNKDQDKLFFVNAYNASLVYYFLDDMENASKWAKELERVDQYENMEKGLLNLIEERTKDLENAKAKAVNPYEGLPNATTEKVMQLNAKYDKERAEIELKKQIEVEKALALEAMRTAPVINEYTGYILNRKQEKTEGSFKEYLNNTGDKSGNIYFIAKGTTKETIISTASMTECHFDNRDYEAVKYFTVGDGFENDLMYIKYQSPKITVYKGSNGYIYYLKPGEKTATNTNSLLWGSAFKKSTAVFFQDCPALVTKIDNGDYPASEEMRIALATDYSDLCK